MQYSITPDYPPVINNKHGIILGIKLIPSGLPKEGPQPLQVAGLPGILMACNLWGQDDDMYWNWYTPPDGSLTRMIETFIRSQVLSLNQWYYLDVFDFDKEFPQ